MAETLPVTPQGILVPRSLLEARGDIQEVKIVQRPDAIILRPKRQLSENPRDRMIEEMKAAGLIDDLPWAPSSGVSAEERAHLAKVLSRGKPLSEIIIEDREDRA